MSRHRRQLGLLAILERLGWQRDPRLWNVPCLDGYGHGAQLSVRLGMGWVTLDHPDIGLLYLTPPHVGKLRGALRHALLDLELFGGADLPDPAPRSERVRDVGAVPPRNLVLPGLGTVLYALAIGPLTQLFLPWVAVRQRR